METIRVEDTTLILASPTEFRTNWIGQELVKRQLLAAWTLLDEDDIPLNPRLVGPPGIGKTTLAYSVAKQMGKQVWFFQATMDTRPEDLIISPVLNEENKVSYVASPIVTAMIKGGVVIIDEGNRMSEKAWASLAPLLDQRRYVESQLTGLVINAHPEFRIAITMNEDATTYDVPEFILTRLRPIIELQYPSEEEEREILKYHVPQAPEDLVNKAVTLLQRAHTLQLPYTVRGGIQILRYSLKLSQINGTSPSHEFNAAVYAVLGSDAYQLI